jgi:hypothetical protein
MAKKKKYHGTWHSSPDYVIVSRESTEASGLLNVTITKHYTFSVCFLTTLSAGLINSGAECCLIEPPPPPQKK